MKFDFLKNLQSSAQEWIDKTLHSKETHTHSAQTQPTEAPRLHAGDILEDSWIRLFLNTKALERALEDEDGASWHLAVSGGGLLGFFPAEVLYRIDQRLNVDMDTAFSAANMEPIEFSSYVVPDFFNNVQAISTGSIIGTLLSIKNAQGTPQTTRTVLQLYLEEDPNLDTPADERVFYRWSPEKRSEVLWHKMDKFLKAAKTADTCFSLQLRVLADTEVNRHTVAFGSEELRDILASDAIVASCSYPGALTKKEINGISYIDTGTEVPPMHCARLFIDFTVQELEKIDPQKPSRALILLGTGIFAHQKEEMSALIEEANARNKAAGRPTLDYFHIEPKEEGFFQKGLGDHVFNPDSIPSLLVHAQETLTGTPALAYASPFKDATLEALYQRLKGRMLVRIYKLQQHIQASKKTKFLDFSHKTLKALGLERYGRLCIKTLEANLDTLDLQALNLSGSLDPNIAFNQGLLEGFLDTLVQSQGLNGLIELDLTHNGPFSEEAQKTLSSLKAKNPRLTLLAD